MPQGSNLGPLLFLLFINGLCNSLSCNRLLFADACKLYCAITDLRDCLFLQGELDKLFEWCAVNRLALNMDKCRVMSYSRKRDKIMFQYALGKVSLTRCETIVDLGVTFDDGLAFDAHIHKLAAMANRSLGFVVRNTRGFSSEHALKSLYFSFVRSKLEYASLIWRPYYQCYITEVDRVQRKFLKYLNFKSCGFYPPRNFDYEILMSSFQLLSLDVRRKHFSRVFLYKLLHGQIECPDLLCRLNFLVPRLSSRQGVLFYCRRSRTNLAFRSPIAFMQNNFNRISNVTDIFNCSLLDLKCKLRSCLRW